MSEQPPPENRPDPTQPVGPPPSPPAAQPGGPGSSAPSGPVGPPPGRPDPATAPPPSSQPHGYGPPPGVQGPPPGGPAQPPWGAPPTGGPQHQPDPFSDPAGASRGFFAALFDFRFTSFVTPTIVKVVYVLVTILIALSYVGFLVSSLRAGVLTFLFVLVAGAVGALVYLALARITLEFMYAIVRMSEDIHQRLPRG